MAGVRRIVILGHSGYIGAHLQRAFCRTGTLDVVGRSKAETDLTHAAEVDALAPLCDDGTALVMCAAIKKQLGDTPDILMQNLAMVMNVVRLVAQHPVARLVFLSSTAVYGEDVQSVGTTEQSSVSPTSYYGIGKFTAERIFLKTVSALPSTSLMVVRPALVYGPDEPAVFYGPSGFLKAALAGDPITRWGDGEELREFIYIDDLVEVVRRLTLDSYDGVLNIVSGTSHRFVDALRIVGSLVSHPLDIRAKPRTKAKVDHTFDNAALMARLPGFSFTTLEEGLRRIAASI